MPDDTSANEAFVLEFLEDWSKSDAKLLASRFAEDAYYRNIPAPQARGRANIEELIGQLFAFSGFRMEVVGIASRGNIVYTERIDHHTFPDPALGPLALPVFGVFVLEKGLIQEWREYFDLGTVEEFAGVKFH